jgi:transcriptional regulator with XRE-family HTH domain
MNKTQLKDRLRTAMQGPPVVSGADLARAVGVKPPSVSDWLSGKSQSLKGENLKRAASKLSVNAAWLSLGEGPMRGSEPARTQVGTSRAVATIESQLSPVWIAEVAHALRMHAESKDLEFDIETPEGSDDFAHWYAVRTLLPDVLALENVIELESRRSLQKGSATSGHDSRAAPTKSHERKR